MLVLFCLVKNKGIKNVCLKIYNIQVIFQFLVELAIIHMVNEMRVFFHNHYN